MKKRAISRLTALILALTLLCTLCILCPGCEQSGPAPERSAAPEPESSAQPAEPGPAGEPDTLQVLIDVEFSSPFVTPLAEGMGNRLVDNLKLSGGKIGEVEFAYLPKEGADREAALTRMRTEIMSGQGPDLFICGCTNPQAEEEPLFRFPMQAMENQLFLPLDEYFASAQFTEYEKLLPMAMEAGRNQEGQQLVPLAFTLPVTVFRKEEVQHQHSQTMTWAQQLEGDAAMQLSAVPNPSNCLYRSMPFLALADYETESLCFTQEELGSCLETLHRLPYEQEKLEVPEHFTTGRGVCFINHPGENVMYYDSSHHGGLRADDVFTMVPAYSSQGGYGAYITSFAAINRNTDKPEEAFLLLDYLLSPDGARSELYGRLLDKVGMPVHMDLGEMGGAVAAVAGGAWWMSDENYQEYCSLRDNIAAMRFSTPLERHITQALWDIDSIEWKRSQGEKTDSEEKIIANAYRTMKMELGES